MSIIKKSAESCLYLEFLLQKLHMLEGWPLLAQLLQYFLLKLFRASRPPRQAGTSTVIPSDPPAMFVSGRMWERKKP